MNDTYISTFIFIYLFGCVFIGHYLCRSLFFHGVLYILSSMSDNYRSTLISMDYCTYDLGFLLLHVELHEMDHFYYNSYLSLFLYMDWGISFLCYLYIYVWFLASIWNCLSQVAYNVQSTL